MRQRIGVLMLALGLWFGGVVNALASPDAPQQLTVALYPWVPRVDQFEHAIQAEWSKVQPGIRLNFLSSNDWDGGYSKDPPANADVFVYDAIFFEYFHSRNWLEPLAATEVQNLDDFVSYAIEGVKVGDMYYSIPQLGCASLLFYRKTDAALVAATTLTDVKTTLHQCTYTSTIPPDERGLLIDMAGNTTNASLYLDTTHSLNGVYPLPLPLTSNDLNPTSVANMRTLLAIASYKNGIAKPDRQYERARWFSNGWGRAIIAYSESMHAMSEETRQNLDFKIMPFSDNQQSPLFYADVIGVNPATRTRGTRSLAVQLANVMAASATMVQSIGPDTANHVPQYIFATRPSTLQTLAETFPLYQKMVSLLATSNPLMFKLDARSRDWLAKMSTPIKQAARGNYSCGCDVNTTQSIPNYATAQSACPTVCSMYGGWNGQWTNKFPAAPHGQSACGCNACSESSAK